jgi:hypothetical protein
VVAENITTAANMIEPVIKISHSFLLSTRARYALTWKTVRETKLSAKKVPSPICAKVNFVVGTMLGTGRPMALTAGIAGIGIMELFEVSQAVGLKVICPHSGP